MEVIGNRLYFGVFVIVSTYTMTAGSPVDIPMVDKMGAALKATFDMSVLNGEIRAIIQEEVKQGIEREVRDKADHMLSKKLNETVNILETKFATSAAELLKRPQVSLTGCIRTKTDLNYEDIFKFENIVTAVGIGDSNTFVTTGVFTCQHEGVYFVSVTVVSKMHSGIFTIDKNNKEYTRSYIGTYSSQYFPSTAVTTMELERQDTIRIRARSLNRFYAFAPYTCLTIFRL